MIVVHECKYLPYYCSGLLRLHCYCSILYSCLLWVDWSCILQNWHIYPKSHSRFKIKYEINLHIFVFGMSFNSWFGRIILQWNDIVRCILTCKVLFKIALQVVNLTHWSSDVMWIPLSGWRMWSSEVCSCFMSQDNFSKWFFSLSLSYVAIRPFSVNTFLRNICQK